MRLQRACGALAAHDTGSPEFHGSDATRAGQLKVEIEEGRAEGIRWREIQDYFRRAWHKPAPFVPT